jgi:hypothetical protein
VVVVEEMLEVEQVVLGLLMVHQVVVLQQKQFFL